MGGIAQAELAINWSITQDAVDAGIVIDDSDDSRTDAVLHYLAAYDYYSARLAGWEARNLRMASHLSELMIANPGKRVLYIVGSGHKPILDRLFSGMSWIRVVPAAEVLGSEP